MTKKIKKLLVTASTFPANNKDPVPRFVEDHVKALKKYDPDIEIFVLAPHNAYANTMDSKQHADFLEHRFHYFWPFTNLELLTGRAIVPALKKNPLLYFQIPFLFIATTFATCSQIKKHDPDLVYAHWFTPQGVAAAFACLVTKKKFIFTTHAGDVKVWKLIPLSKHLIKWVCDRASLYTAVSNQTADKLYEMLPDSQIYRDKMTIIPMGTEIEAKSSSVKLSNKTTNILFIGRLVTRKGVDYLLNALAGLKNQKYQLVIAGEGPDQLKLQELTKKLGLDKKVQFVGFVSGDQKREHYQNSDIVCIPSVDEITSTEGMPVSLMEAVSYGKITISSNVSGAQEYITDGEQGYIFTEKNTEQLTEKLKAAMSLNDDRYRKMSESAYELSKNFDWDILAPKYYKLLQKAARL